MKDRFQEDPSWWRQDEVLPIVSSYYMALDQVLEQADRSSYALVSCCHCHIVFVTTPQNGHRDVRCPFGCRQTHRRRRSSQRSKDYYQTEQGKFKKKRLNRRRYLIRSDSDVRRESSDNDHTPFLNHLQFLIYWIDQRETTLKQVEAIVKALIQKWRQHGSKFLMILYKVPSG